MLEVMALLRNNGFRPSIVSGGGQQFIRAYAERVYGIPPEQVIGSTAETTYELPGRRRPRPHQGGQAPAQQQQPGKPEDIDLFIGRRPVAAFGNSTGDQQMLEWTAAGERAH